MNTESGLHAPSVIGIPPAGAQRRSKHVQPDANVVRLRPTGPQAWLPPADAVDTGVAAQKHSAEVLLRGPFLKQLSREKRRADRSKAALSLVLCRLDQSAPGPLSMGSLLDLLRKSTRDTDFIGWLADEELAVLLPDTDREGALRFTEKLTAKVDSALLSATSVTYPDHVFDDIASGDGELLDKQPLLLDHESAVNDGGHYALKRGLDVLGSLFALAVLSPLMLAVAIAVAWSSPGPIIFRQTRIGRRGVPFVFYKFRSMRCDTDDRIHREFVENLIKGDHGKNRTQEDAKPLYKIKADPRVTAVGAFIRRTSIDEIPQFFNVLKGDMSLVGPRPPLPYEAKAYQSWHLRRVLESKPGITGLWQVEGRSKVTFDEMVRMDLRYVRECSLRLDLRILFKTVKVVVGDDGAT